MRVRVEFCYRNFEVVAFDETHGVIRSTVGVSAKTVDRNNSGMLQTARDLGFEHES